MSTRYLVIAVVFVTVVWDARVAGAQLSHSHLAARDGGYVFVQTISTRAPRWAEVEVNNADGSRKCEWLKKLDAKQTYRFECPVTVAAGDTVPSRVRLYKDAKLEDRESFTDPVLTVTASVLTAAIKAEAAPAGSVIVPEGVLEAADLPLPSTFKPTWYRRLAKGFSLRAYENSGNLTIEAAALVFVDGKKTVRIPFGQITSVRWEPLDNDIANHWTAVRFTNDEGKPDGVAFRDGGMMGHSQGTGMIYVTLHRAAKK